MSKIQAAMDAEIKKCNAFAQEFHIHSFLTNHNLNMQFLDFNTLIKIIVYADDCSIDECCRWLMLFIKDNMFSSTLFMECIKGEGVDNYMIGYTKPYVDIDYKTEQYYSQAINEIFIVIRDEANKLSNEPWAKDHRYHEGFSEFKYGIDRNEMARILALKGIVIEGLGIETQADLGSQNESANAVSEILIPKIDPSDLPEELGAANIAFRAVYNGYGDQKATFKNRLIAYLSENYHSFSNEARNRIATIANPDKTTGRKKHSNRSSMKK